MASAAESVVVLGGGFAGLSCAVRLAAAGRAVTVLEKKPHLGGRAYSFKDQETGDLVDNGQHLFMGAYRETIDFLALIGTGDLLAFGEEIRVDYADATGARDALSCPTALGAPLHLALGVLGLKGISLADKWGLIQLDAYLKQVKKAGKLPAALDRITVREWMTGLGQSARIQERVFDPVALGALNDDPDVAAATGFVQVLLRGFYEGVDESRLGLATVGLSDLYTAAAKEFVESRGGKILLNSKAKSVRSKKVVLESGVELDASAVVSTLPPWDLLKLDLPAELRGSWEKLKPAPIVSISLWLDRVVMTEPFIGLLGTEIQWAFNKTKIHSLPGGGQYLALVISGAHKHVASDPKALLELAKRDLVRCIPGFEKATIKRWKVVKEPFATLSPVPGSDAQRPGHASPVKGFYFAGDWTQTGLPATIESAVLSGRRAAELILKEDGHA